jgi:predicted RNA binding protein YcfA (HicA-like mRNA interferase family)
VNGFYREVVEELSRNNFRKVPGGKGSHEKWECGSVRVLVPFHCKSRHTANAVMKAAGLARRF